MLISAEISEVSCPLYRAQKVVFDDEGGPVLHP